jgi:hypothetical protein
MLWLKLVNNRPLIAEAQVRAQVSPFGFCGGQSGAEHVLLTVLRFSSVTVIRPWLHTHLRDKQ